MQLLLGHVTFRQLEVRVYRRWLLVKLVEFLIYSLNDYKNKTQHSILKF